MVHVQRRGTVYSWRRRVPLPLAQRWGRRELVKSLHTSSRAVAVRRARELSTLADTLFDTLMEDAAMTPAQIDALVRQWFETVMNGWEQRDLMRPQGGTALKHPHGIGGDPVKADVTVLSEFRERARKALANNDLTSAEGIVAGILEEAGIALAPDSEAYRRLCRGILRAQVEYLRLAEARRAGDFTVTPADPLFTVQPTAPPAALPPPPSPPPQDAPKSLPLNELVAMHVAARVRDGIWRPNTRRTAAPVLEQFAETLGNKPVDEVTRDDIRDWREALQGMEMGNNTIRRHFKIVSALFNWAKEEKKATIDNPTRRLAPQAEETKRDIYRPDDLAKLFHSPLYTGHWRADRRDRPGTMLVKDHKFWFPLIALHTGLRIEELAKLKKADVQKIDSVWCFVIYNTKTDAGNREVPIHPRLIDIGFLDYHASVDHERLWPDLEPGAEGKFSARFAQWWPAFRHLIGLDREGLVFHSFRHTFVSYLEFARVPEAEIARLVGHEYRGITIGTYGGKLVTPQMKLDAYKDVDFGVDLSHLYVTKWEQAGD